MMLNLKEHFLFIFLSLFLLPNVNFGKAVQNTTDGDVFSTPLNFSLVSSTTDSGLNITVASLANNNSTQTNGTSSSASGTTSMPSSSNYTYQNKIFNRKFSPRSTLTADLKTTFGNNDTGPVTFPSK